MIQSITIGAILALLSIVIIKKVFPNKEIEVWRISLVIAALLYVSFAIIGRTYDYLPLELGGVLVYGFFAYLSKKHSLYWLAIGWALHIGWDVFLHLGPNTDFVPLGYPIACIGFDIIIASYICWLIVARK